MKKKTFKLLIVVFLFFYSTQTIICVNWSYQEDLMIFDNSFNTWTKPWNIIENIKTSESIEYVSILDDEIKNYKNFSFVENINELSFNTLNEFNDESEIEIFSDKEDDFSILDLF